MKSEGHSFWTKVLLIVFNIREMSGPKEVVNSAGGIHCNDSPPLWISLSYLTKSLGWRISVFISLQIGKNEIFPRIKLTGRKECFQTFKNRMKNDAVRKCIHRRVITLNYFSHPSSLDLFLPSTTPPPIPISNMRISKKSQIKYSYISPTTSTVWSMHTHCHTSLYVSQNT